MKIQDYEFGIELITATDNWIANQEVLTFLSGYNSYEFVIKQIKGAFPLLISIGTTDFLQNIPSVITASDPWCICSHWKPIIEGKIIIERSLLNPIDPTLYIAIYTWIIGEYPTFTKEVTLELDYVSAQLGPQELNADPDYRTLHKVAYTIQ